MNKSSVGGAIIALGCASGLIFLIIAINEFHYKSQHPYAYGPALELAWGGIAGALLGLAVALVGLVLTRPRN